MKSYCHLPLLFMLLILGVSLNAQDLELTKFESLGVYLPLNKAAEVSPQSIAASMQNELQLSSLTNIVYSHQSEDLNTNDTRYHFDEYYNGVLINNGGVLARIQGNDCVDNLSYLVVYQPDSVVANVNSSADRQSITSSSNYTLKSQDCKSYQYLESEVGWEISPVWEVTNSEDSALYNAVVRNNEVIILGKTGYKNHHTAPTEVYGDVELLDALQVWGEIELTTDVCCSQFNGVYTYNSNGGPPVPGPSTIPSRYTPGPWTTSTAPPAVYQAHHVVSQIDAIAESLFGVNSARINVFANTGIIGNAYSDGVLSQGTDIVFGRTRFSSPASDVFESLAIWHIAGHEYFHAYMNDFFLSGGSFETNALHEGASDLFGYYINWKMTGEWHWNLATIEDGMGFLRAADGRDPSSPLYDCVSEAPNSSSDALNVYRTGSLMTIWLHNVIENNNFSSGEIDLLMTSFLQSISEMNGVPTIDEVISGTIRRLYFNEGTCTDLVQTALDTWSAMQCGQVDNSIDPCSEVIYTIPSEACYGSNIFMQIHGVYGGDYRWFIPYEWTTLEPRRNGSVYGAQVTVTGMPIPTYLPRTYRIVVRNNLTSEQRELSLTINDCYSEFPDCEDVVASDDSSIGLIINSKGDGVYVLYDVSGRRLKESADAFDFIEMGLVPGIYIVRKPDGSTYQKAIIR